MKPDNDSSNPSAPAVNEHANSEADRRVKQIASTKQKTVITLGSWDRREDERTQIFVLDWNQSRTLAARAEARARSCSSLSLSLPCSLAVSAPLSLLCRFVSSQFAPSGDGKLEDGRCALPRQLYDCILSGDALYKSLSAHT